MSNPLAASLHLECCAIILHLNGKRVPDFMSLPSGDPETALEERVTRLSWLTGKSRKQVRSILMDKVQSALGLIEAYRP